MVTGIATIIRILNPLFDVSRLSYELFVLSTRISLEIIIATYRLLIPVSMKNLCGETVLVTGAGHGIGKELAVQLAGMGCIVVCWDNDRDANRSTMNEILEAGGEVYGYVVDVAKRMEIREAVRLMRKVGIPEVTILVNNAAILMHKSLLSHEDNEIEDTFAVNVFSNFWTIEAFLPAMLQNDKGHIVCMSSMCGIYGIPQKVPYCSSKFAIRGFMEALREEVRLFQRKLGVRFTTIYPFYVNTGLARDPKYRFPYIFRAVSPAYAAQEVIKAVRRDYTEYSIPRCLFSLNSINRILPESAMRLILDYLADISNKEQQSEESS
ncbi:epidermal retinol dehydrogenase 2 isoform X2 [Cephus cinctus]|uniref:Short-chain dehydrogenase/reductase 3 n=1 Tax=Cephus cinctus TaxID=211228 RepID=A0AAJ7FEM3_CEPCN|nr:epidermal retinol dehydrogenase 2 isoform X2 [Cephus cinctus]